MDNSGLFVVEWTLKGLVGVFATLAALFAFLDVLHGEKQGRVREWFGQKWEAIRVSSWLAMPERVVWRALTMHYGLVSYVEVHVIRRGMARGFYGATVLLVWVVVSAYAFRFAKSAFLSMSIIAVSGLCLILLYWAARQAGGLSLLEHNPLIIITTIGIVAFAAGIPLLLDLPIEAAAFAMLLLLPLSWFLPFILWIGVENWSASRFNSVWDRWLYSPDAPMFCYGVGIGFSATLLALLIGHAARPQAWIPQTPQMLFSNVLCDGMTLVATHMLLSRAVASPGLFRIPAAVLADIFVAALLACASLYVGLAFIDNALSTREVLNVLVGRSPDGSGWDFGPYFWAMHTTFLPTLAYLSLIMVAWLGKVMLLPVRWFFGVGQEHKNPLKLTAALCGLIATIFAVVAGLL